MKRIIIPLIIFVTIIVIVAIIAALIKGGNLFVFKNIKLFGKNIINHGMHSFNYKYENAKEYLAGNTEVSGTGINKIDIDWISGNVKVSTHNGENIIIREIEGLDDEYKLHYLVKGNELKIKFKKSNSSILKLDRDDYKNIIKKKELEVLLPEDMKDKNINLAIETVSADVSVDGLGLSELDAETVSGAIVIWDLVITEADLESVSGNINIKNVVCDKLDAEGVSSHIESKNLTVKNVINAETVSGAITLKGEFNKVDSESVSGNIVIESSVCPSVVDLKTVSGNMRLVIPENDGFTAKKDGISKKISCDFAVKVDDSKLIYKNGGAKFDFETVSGSVKITFLA